MKGITLTARISKKLYERMQKHKEATGTPFVFQIERALEKYLEEFEHGK